MYISVNTRLLIPKVVMNVALDFNKVSDLCVDVDKAAYL